MNRLFQIVCLISINFLLIHTYASNDEGIVKMKTNISDIIIFNNGATVNRKGNVALKNGTNTILVPNISSKLINESIQFTIDSKNVIINSVNKQFNYFGIENNNQVVKLQDSIKNITESIRLKNNQFRSI